MFPEIQLIAAILLACIFFIFGIDSTIIFSSYQQLNRIQLHSSVPRILQLVLLSGALEYHPLKCDIFSVDKYSTITQKVFTVLAPKQIGKHV